MAAAAAPLPGASDDSWQLDDEDDGGGQGAGDLRSRSPVCALCRRGVCAACLPLRGCFPARYMLLSAVLPPHVALMPCCRDHRRAQDQDAGRRQPAAAGGGAAAGRRAGKKPAAAAAAADLRAASDEEEPAGAAAEQQQQRGRHATRAATQQQEEAERDTAPKRGAAAAGKAKKAASSDKVRVRCCCCCAHQNCAHATANMHAQSAAAASSLHSCMRVLAHGHAQRTTTVLHTPCAGGPASGVQVTQGGRAGRSS